MTYRFTDALTSEASACQQDCSMTADVIASFVNLCMETSKQAYTLCAEVASTENAAMAAEEIRCVSVFCVCLRAPV